MYRIDLSGFKNHINDASGRLKMKIYKKKIKSQISNRNRLIKNFYFGFSSASGSFLPSPAGFCSDSSFVSK